MSRHIPYRPQAITDELKAIAPSLAEGFHMHPWTLPSGYFEQLERHVHERIAREEAVPKGYFEQLPDQVMARIRQSEQAITTPVPNQVSEDESAEALPDAPAAQHNGKVILLRHWQRWAAAAAVVAIVFLTALRIINQPAPQTNTASLATTSDEAIAQYVMENIEQWNAEELSQFADVSNISLIDSSANPPLEEYLLEDIDLSDLEELL